MMEVFKHKEAWTYLFKEKKWGYKLGVPYLVSFIFVALLIPVIIGLVGGLAVSRGGSNGVVIIFALLFLCLFIAFILVYSIIVYWYDYEITQAAMTGRHTNLIWTEGFMTVVKKSSKLGLVRFIYGLPLALVYSCFYILTVLMIGNSVNTMSYVSTVSRTNFYSPGLILIILGMLLFTIIIAVPYSFFVEYPARFRMIHSNTFKEAFKLSEVLYISKKYYKYFGMYLGIIAAYLIGYIALNTLFSLISLIPILGLCIVPFSFLLPVIFGYFILFVMPYMGGSMYGHILKEEKKHVESKTK